MSYDDHAHAMTRTPVTLVIITLDFCGRTFGVAPCTATGEPCYNTFHTCKDKNAYLKTTRDYEFSSTDVPALPPQKPVLLVGD